MWSMQLFCDSSLGAIYKSASQQARVISESWYLHNVYCFACDSMKVEQAPSNTKVFDFVCPKCKHRYQLKTLKGKMKSSLVDGAYEAMMNAIQIKKVPTFSLLERTPDWQIHSLTAIHSSFFIPQIIERRRPLSQNARRAGWIGCNIRLDQIPYDGKIVVISNGVVQSPKEVRRRFKIFLPLAKKSVEQKGWTMLTLRMVRQLGKQHFNLQEMYEFEDSFAEVYPDNKHIKDKIRQQLQVLRDLGVLEFGERGEYRLID